MEREREREREREKEKKTHVTTHLNTRVKSSVKMPSCRACIHNVLMMIICTKRQPLTGSLHRKAITRSNCTVAVRSKPSIMHLALCNLAPHTHTNTLGASAWD